MNFIQTTEVCYQVSEIIAFLKKSFKISNSDNGIFIHLLTFLKEEWCLIYILSFPFLGSPHTAAQKQDDQHERTFSSYVRIQVVVLKTYLGRWTIGRSGERGSGISVLPARYDDDDDLGVVFIWPILYWKVCFFSLRDINIVDTFLDNQTFRTKIWKFNFTVRNIS